MKSINRKNCTTKEKRKAYVLKFCLEKKKSAAKKAFVDFGLKVILKDWSEL